MTSPSTRTRTKPHDSRSRLKKTDEEGASLAFYFFLGTILLSVLALLGGLLFL